MAENTGVNTCTVEGEVLWREKPKTVGEGKDHKVVEIRMAIPGVGEDAEHQEIRVSAWDAKGDAAKAIKKGDHVRVTGEVRGNDWDAEDGKKNSVVEVHLNPGNDDHVVEKIEAGDGLNTVTLKGKVLWSGGLETFGENETVKQRLFVGIPITLGDGREVTPSVAVELIGKAAEEVEFKRDDPIEIEGALENRSWLPEADGAKRRYNGTVKVLGSDGRAEKIAA